MYRDVIASISLSTFSQQYVSGIHDSELFSGLEVEYAKLFGVEDITLSHIFGERIITQSQRILNEDRRSGRTNI
jgi:hypothetical protein